jgi:type IX secretion system PorP/SprF family membrane protein
VIINHRNQWLGAGTQFMTTSVAADANFGKNQLNTKAHVGLGLMFYNDIGGDSKFGAQNGSLTLSGILPIGGGHQLSAGIQGGFGSRKADFSSLTFSSQWNGSTYDQSILSGESNGMSFHYMEANAGVYYVFDGGESSFKRNNDLKLQFGISGYHLNKPELKYITVSGDRLYRKFVLHAGVVADVANTNWSIDANALQFIQGPHLETILGMLLRYRFQDGTKITGNFQDAYFGFGTFYRFKDALVPTINVSYRGFKFGISYDVTVSTMRKAYTGGSLEFSLSYTNLSHALFKSRKRF